MISIIIPVYNGQRYIGQAIDSILEQTYKDYEIIVIDDGSTDKTRDCIEKYGDKISYVYQANKGPAGAKNTGIRLARGDYLQFLDADDLLLPQKLERQICFLKINPDYEVVYSDYMFFREDDLSQQWSREGYRLSGDILYALIKDLFFPVHAPLLRSACLKGAGLFNENLITGEDWDLWLRLACSGARFYFLNEVLCLYRRHEGTLTGKRTLIMKNKIQVIETASREMISKEARKRLRVKQQLAHYHWLLGREYIKIGQTIKGILEIIRYYPVFYLNKLGFKIRAIRERILCGGKISPELSKVEAFLITTGERTSIEAYNSIMNQSMPVNKIVVLRDISGIHNSLNALHERISSEYFIKVDADMILKRNCVETLYKILKKDPQLYSVQGYLKDPLLGRIWGIHMFRAGCVKDYRYSDTIGTDAEFEKTMENKGYRQIKYKKILGIHHPEYSRGEIKQKFVREGEKINFFKDITRLNSNIRHLMKFIRRGRREAFYALLYMYLGLVRRTRREKDFALYNQEGLFEEKQILKKFGIEDALDRKAMVKIAHSMAKKCHELFKVGERQFAPPYGI